MSRADLLRSVLGQLVACPTCGRRAAGAHGACGPCRHRLASIAGGVEHDRIRALWVAWAGPYDGAHRRAVRALKYGGRRDVARPLGGIVAQRVRAAGWPVDRVAFVPLHRWRRLRRGYDQAAVLAASTAHALGVPVWRGLRRVRTTHRQARLEGDARDANVADAFASDRTPRVPVLLIDDVWTTGATAAACARALRRAGAREVRVAVVCRARPAGEVRLRVPAWADLTSPAGPP
ncbi:MAG: phosphoribosyltransferase family protein [Trueperaceae bacterium]